MVAAFPALVDTGQGVEQRLVDTASEAERLTRQGLARLFAIKHHRSLRGHVAHLPGLSAAGIKLGHLVGGQEFTSHLQDLIARMALVEGQPLVRTREEFDARNARAAGLISVAAQEVAAWLPKLAEEAHQVRLLTEQAPQPWREVFDDIAKQLQELLPAEFLRHTPWNWLAEVPRYLQAVRARVDKLKSGGLPKDRKLREPIESAWLNYQQLVANSRNQAPEFMHQVHELRWMIEELRVSIFAQQLGTKISVSPKRLQSLIDSLM